MQRIRVLSCGTANAEGLLSELTCRFCEQRRCDYCWWRHRQWDVLV